MIKGDSAIMERYYNLPSHEQQIVRSAAKDINKGRGLSLCRLYFPGCSDDRIIAFMINIVRQQVA